MEQMKPPKAKQIQHTHRYHGEDFPDFYHHLADRESAEVLAHLHAENAYTESVMRDTETLQKELFEEMKARIQEDDTSAPIQIDSYFYYTRTEKGKEYPVFCRKQGSLEANEEILLDQNTLAEGNAHCALGVFRISPDHKKLAYSLDLTGAERYTLFIYDIPQKTLLPERIENMASAEWTPTGGAIVYTELDALTRPSRVLVRRIGSGAPSDALLFEEKDPRYFVSLHKSKSKKYFFIESGGHSDTEVYILKADGALAPPTLIHPREKNHEYSLEHWVGKSGEECFFVRTNDNAKNFKLMRAPIDTPGKANWSEIIPHREEVTLEDIEVFEKFLCVYELEDALDRVRILPLEGGGDERILIGEEEAYEFSGESNPVYQSTHFRYGYSSLKTPDEVREYDMDRGVSRTLKTREIPSGYDASLFEVKRVYAKAKDGAEIPLSLIYKKGTKKDGSAPCFLYGYGSYGMSIPAGFSTTRLSLLERGFVFAIAHIRGGGEKGRGWYESGKFLEKRNTFDDFIASAEYLIEEGVTSPERLVACGRSAGGMLMGAVANERPDLFRAIIAGVPFVDVLNTMMNPDIPLTVLEYDEWGDPNDKKFFEAIRAYSPYDNVKRQAYPHMLVTAGLSDPRVQYFEPAKWVAKLREYKTDDNLILLKTEMDHGHRGKTGRFSSLVEVAFEHAFILGKIGV